MQLMGMVRFYLIPADTVILHLDSNRYIAMKQEEVFLRPAVTKALLNANGSNADGNSAFGSDALRSNTTGSVKLCVGYGCMSSNTTGLHNVAVGYGAFEYNTSGSANVAVGQRALNWNTTGQRNTAVGEGANTTTFIGTFNNITAIGNEAIVDASNKIRLGDNSVSSIGGQVGWTNFSDGRIKKRLKEMSRSNIYK